MIDFKARGLFKKQIEKMENPNPPAGNGALPWSTFFVFLLLAILLGGMLGSLLVYLLTTIIGTDLATALDKLQSENTVSVRNLLRSANLITHVMSFAVPALVVAYFFYRKAWFKVLKLDRRPQSWNILWGTLFMLVAFPFSQFTFWLNKQIPLPSWARRVEDSVEGLLEGFLLMESPWELAFTLLVVAITPAIGEELIYRGLVQQKLTERINVHLAIWLSAFIFSSFHLQLEGIIPRMFLGAILGYLFYWTQNLWIPIVAHFFLNGIQVTIPYFYSDTLKQLELDQPLAVNWWATLLSIVLTLSIGYTIMKKNQKV